MGAKHQGARAGLYPFGGEAGEKSINCWNLELNLNINKYPNARLLCLDKAFIRCNGDDLCYGALQQRSNCAIAGFHISKSVGYGL